MAVPVSVAGLDALLNVRPLTAGSQVIRDFRLPANPGLVITRQHWTALGIIEPHQILLLSGPLSLTTDPAGT
jgi:hypothetical protein